MSVLNVICITYEHGHLPCRAIKGGSNHLLLTLTSKGGRVLSTSYLTLQSKRRGSTIYYLPYRVRVGGVLFTSYLTL